MNAHEISSWARVRLWPFAFLGAALAVLAVAQQAPESGEIRATTTPYRPRTAYRMTTDTRPVEIDAAVRDPQGRTAAYRPDRGTFPVLGTGS